MVGYITKDCVLHSEIPVQEVMQHIAMQAADPADSLMSLINYTLYKVLEFYDLTPMCFLDSPTISFNASAVCIDVPVDRAAASHCAKQDDCPSLCVAFKSIDDVLAYSNIVADYVSSNVVIYEHNSKYYLYLVPCSEFVQKCTMIACEFGQLSDMSPVYLEEHGKLLLSGDNVLSKLRSLSLRSNYATH